VRVTVVMTEERVLECLDNDDKHAITVESIFAEVICKKDSAAILKLTINNKLVEAMQEISESKLEMAVGGMRDTQCKFMSLTRVSTNTCCKVNLYVVFDLAFDGMVLGRENMMGG